MSCHFYSQITCDQTFLHFSDIYMSDLQKHNFRIIRPAFGRVVCSGGQTTVAIFYLIATISTSARNFIEMYMCG